MRTWWNNFQSLLTKQCTIKEKGHPKLEMHAIYLIELWTLEVENRWRRKHTAPSYFKLWNPINYLTIFFIQIDVMNEVLQ